MNATKPDSLRALERIRLLIPRTPTNGCSEAETDAALRAIGRLVQKYPEMLGLRPNTETQQQTDGNTIELHHGGVLRETERAVLFVIRGQQCWLPRSQLASFDRRSVVMTTWIAEQKGFASL